MFKINFSNIFDELLQQGPEGEKKKFYKKIHLDYYRVEPEQQSSTYLIGITSSTNIVLQNDSDEGKVIVFMGTQAMVDYHTELFATVLPNINFYKLHGKMTQVERTDVFKSFRSFQNGVLMCSVCILYLVEVYNSVLSS